MRFFVYFLFTFSVDLPSFTEPVSGCTGISSMLLETSFGQRDSAPTPTPAPSGTVIHT